MPEINLRSFSQRKTHRAILFFLMLFSQSAFATTDSKQSLGIKDLRQKFEETRNRALGANFTSPESRKAYLEELENLARIFESASAIVQKQQTADFKVTAESKALTSMAIELSFLEELEAPVKSKFARQSCVDSLAATQASIEAHAELSKRVIEILKKNCPAQK